MTWHPQVWRAHRAQDVGRSLLPRRGHVAALGLLALALPATALADPEVKLTHQTDGVSRARVVKVALYCNHAGGPCVGTVKLTASGATIGSVPLNAESGRTTKVPVKVTKSAYKSITKHRHRLAATEVVTLSDGTSYSQGITLAN